MLVHVVSEMVIVVARTDQVIVVVVTARYNHTTLTGRWATVAWVIIRIVAIPHVDSFLVGGRITPSGSSIINFQLPADGGRGRLFPASWLHALVLFAATAPARCVLLHGTRPTP